MLKISDGRKHFWQWDLNQKLLVEYENVCHVHFEDPDGDVALTVETYDLDGKKVADVPNILLQKPQTIHAYVYKCEGDECTIEHTYFNVYERQRPADYVYTETEVQRWETLEERIAALEEGGADGFSPTVDIEPIDGGHRISITDKDGTETADVLDGRDGKDGDPGADGISPTVAVQDITGGHRVTITDKGGAKTFDVMDGAGGSGGDSPAIIDVVALPETDIDEDVFYRVLTGSIYYNQAIRTMDTCYVVETLPETGEPAVTPDMSVLTVYYARNTGTASAYLTPQLADVFGYPAGWYPAEALLAATQWKYGGIVNSLNEMTEAETFYLLIQDVVKYHNDDKWHNLQGIGWTGDGAGAERFNSLLNRASDAFAHAEGYNTTASGESSHAEGSSTTASGDNSHAEGQRTTASGHASHAEGYYTQAHSGQQHVQGRINIADEEGRFAHIVGNGYHRPGTTDMPSNAHTLDWSGNAWFSGSVYVGSTSGVNRDEGSRKLVANGDSEIILTSPSGTRYRLTVADDGTLTTAAV